MILDGRIHRYGCGSFVTTLFAVSMLFCGAARANSIFESYETDFGGWTSDTDVVPHSITRSQDQAHDGDFSLDFSGNVGEFVVDGGAFWAWRSIALTPGTWDIQLDFFMWSPNDDLIGRWDVVALIEVFQPATEHDFTIVGQTNMTAGWRQYTHAETISVSEQTTVYVAYGLAVRFEEQKTYFFDSVTISGLPLVCDEPACNNNGICEAGEDCVNCPCDCIIGSSVFCGNGICEAADGEDCTNCPADCRGVQSGNPNNRFCCGAGGGQNPVGCSDPRCTDSGWSCTDAPGAGSCCGDGVCEGIENSDNCPIDCPPSFCGDGNCDSTEDPCSCPEDCGAPPATETNCSDGIENDCDGLVDCDDPDCAEDPVCQTGCGNGVCEPGEDCLNCPGDCPGLQNGPPSGRFCCGNGILESPEGDGSICDGNP
jgi:hypothetical protein